MNKATAEIKVLAFTLVRKAKAAGLSINITHRPKLPLKMGHVEHVVDIWPARHGAQPVAEPDDCMELHARRYRAMRSLAGMDLSEAKDFLDLLRSFHSEAAPIQPHIFDAALEKLADAMAMSGRIS